MSPEGCETANTAKTVSRQYAPVPLTKKWQIENRSVVFQAVGIKTGLVLTEV